MGEKSPGKFIHPIFYSEVSMTPQSFFAHTNISVNSRQYAKMLKGTVAREFFWN